MVIQVLKYELITDGSIHVLVSWSKIKTTQYSGDVDICFVFLTTDKIVSTGSTVGSKFDIHLM